MYEQRLSDELFKHERVLFVRRHDADEILDMEDSLDVVDRVFVHGNSRVFLFPCDTHYLVVIRIDGQGNDLLSVRHDRRDFLVVELENVVDHFLFGIFDVAGFRAYVDHHADLFFSNALVSVNRRDLEEL